MTKFKFRVWDKEEKHMHYMPAAELYEVLFLRADGVLCDVDESAMHSNGYSKDPRPAYEKYEMSFSTGLYDCDGKEIFEGDYVQYSKEEPNKCPIFEVKFIDGAFVGSLETNCGGMRSHDICHLKELCCDEYYVDGKANFKIIGNRFYNPELLEIKND